MFDFIFDDDFPLYSCDDIAGGDWLYGDSFPYSLYVYPREYHHWKPRLRHVTREGVALELCTYTYHVGVYYRRRLISMVHFPCEVRDIVSEGNGRFYVDFPWGGAHILVHYDHIEHIDGYCHGTEIAEEGFLPPEVTDWRERMAREEALRAGRAARRARLAKMAKAALRRQKQRDRSYKPVEVLPPGEICQSTKSLCSAKNLAGPYKGRFVTVLDAEHRNRQGMPRAPPGSKAEALQRTLNILHKTKTALVRESKPAEGPKICSRLHIRAMRRGPKGPQALPHRSGPDLLWRKRSERD